MDSNNHFNHRNYWEFEHQNYFTKENEPKEYIFQRPLTLKDCYTKDMILSTPSGEIFKIKMLESHFKKGDILNKTMIVIKAYRMTWWKQAIGWLSWKLFNTKIDWFIGVKVKTL